jgi:hypothetical protein
MGRKYGWQNDWRRRQLSRLRLQDDTDRFRVSAIAAVVCGLFMLGGTRGIPRLLRTMFRRRFRSMLPAMRFALVCANSRRKRLKQEPNEENGCGRVAEHRRVVSRSKTGTPGPML